MWPLLVAALLALLVVPPNAADAAADPEGKFAFAPPRQQVANRQPRSPGRAGELRPVRIASSGTGGLPVAVLVEGGLRVSVRAFARAVGDVLRDPRGWRRAGYEFRLARAGGAAIEVVLASPALTDRLCAPLQTLGRYSCAQGTRAVLNVERWQHGAPTYRSLARYRVYMVNHEIGHLLGRGHAYCPAAGARAPLMLQQTKGVVPCRPNPWPLAGE